LLWDDQQPRQHSQQTFTAACPRGEIASRRNALNRLSSAQNAGTNCSATTANGASEYWGNSYGYDAWGNLLQKTVTKCSAESLSVTVLANNQLSGYGYDAAGNMTHDATTSNNYTFDAENRIIGAAGYTYTYDADGNRVEKSNGSTGTLYWSMSPGVVAESDLSGNIQSEYVFFNGKRVARKDLPSGSVSYYFSDHLGTADVITDSAGNIKYDADHYPWGGELPFVNSDANRYKFTGQERDPETGLDLMGRRYYENALGRLMQPDPFLPFNLKKEKFQAWISNPQHWNKYAYALNNPLLYVDPSGLTETVYYFLNKNLTDDQKKFFNDNKDKILGAIADKLKEAGIKDVVFKDGSSLSQSQISSMIAHPPTGVAFLNFANTSYGGHQAAPGEFGGTADVRSVVFLGNLQAGNPSDSQLGFRASEVASHELGHRMGFYSRGETMSFIEFWNKDLMNEGQSMPSSPRHFDMSIPQNRQAVDEINKTPESGACGVNDYRPPQ
jgi:RHS repeat-associated protein